MSTEETSHDRVASRTGRLTHEQVVALLEVVAHLVGPGGVEADAHASLGPSRMRALMAAMEDVGIDAAVIYAYAQTGMLVSEGDEDLCSADDLRRWDAAVAGYRNGPAPART